MTRVVERGGGTLSVADRSFEPSRPHVPAAGELPLLPAANDGDDDVGNDENPPSARSSIPRSRRLRRAPTLFCRPGPWESRKVFWETFSRRERDGRRRDVRRHLKGERRRGEPPMEMKARLLRSQWFSLAPRYEKVALKWHWPKFIRSEIVMHDRAWRGLGNRSGAEELLALDDRLGGTRAPFSAFFPSNTHTSYALLKIATAAAEATTAFVGLGLKEEIDGLS